MEKLISAVVLTFSIMISSAGATDIIITVPDAAVPQVVISIKKVHPNTECEKWDLQTVTCLKKKYTDIDWVKKKIGDMVKEVILAGQNQLINEAYAAKQAELRQTEEEIITTGESIDNYLTVK